MNENDTTLLLGAGGIILLLLISNGYITNPLSVGGSLSSTDFNQDYVPVEHSSCNDYDIGGEFQSFLGSQYFTARDNCYEIGGIWTVTDNEFSCLWHPDVTSIDCNGNAVLIMESFCENTMKAQWTCNNNYAYLGCSCDINVPQYYPGENPFGDGDNGGAGEDITYCEDVELPMYGDLGGICEAQGYCADDIYNCGHYWDYNAGEHKCSCTSANFCGQYCYEYVYTNGCECPPNSYQDWTSRSTFVCVPNGHYCDGNNVVEEVGPFPD